ncbi:hypothetical protein G1L22_13555 [Tenacibaculum finnmarkense]|uniref:hypothetical protein n=1 Tax=Tenacibaculum finnmarkense TaxID=2781243 RepID=UPI001EFBB5A3|nr:hypothetical protein [Tenacibaculum finnmarkense]MCG8740145.1 hypothetical protein [Tenacibaculum finnmarkense]MCG8755544.1 hypothetical protein [Tenacibaculum finnmarkense]MCG8781740.1 hypothetical protein [Tenacibaculum finnmarkense]MCG8784128.1 hypothetical protein [Tenacibaculum finnmarkense]MCG8791586.1 hypothetical protein [Tenacibaculum finnmarkense]
MEDIITNKKGRWVWCQEVGNWLNTKTGEGLAEVNLVDREDFKKFQETGILPDFMK